jgi:hypothetical protein
LDSYLCVKKCSLSHEHNWFVAVALYTAFQSSDFCGKAMETLW